MLMRQYFYGLASFIPALLTWTAIFIATLARQNPELLTHQDVVRPPYVLPRSTNHQLPSHASLKSWGPNPGKRYNKADIAALEKRAVDIFYHGYDNYMKYAFPHDDLKPLTKSYTDSLGDLGGQGNSHHGKDYKGVALTLIDALSTLAVLGNVSEFQKNVAWLSNNLSFDVDVQVNVFEANIRLLGGLLSSHLLASNTEHEPNLTPKGYKGELLWLANDLGLRLLPAFQDSPTGCPYPWVNLRHGMDESSKRITETNVAACGSLILEMGTLSRLTGNPIFEDYALKAIHALMERRSVMDLFGSTINMINMQWTNLNGGIGASSDSFYEYLLKAYILFGIDELWEYFKKVYMAALSHYKVDSWYYDATWMGQPTFIQFASLQSFWPGMQVLAGDVLQGIFTFEAFMSVWVKFGVLPERYYYSDSQLHSSEIYYPLRPELIESNFYLYQATQDWRYLRNGEIFMDSLDRYTKVPGGWASVKNVVTGEKEDHMHSYFLAEACKYLFLLYNNSFLKDRNVIFTTEGHPLYITYDLQNRSSLLKSIPAQFQPSKTIIKHADMSQNAVKSIVAQITGQIPPGGNIKGLECTAGQNGEILCQQISGDSELLNNVEGEAASLANTMQNLPPTNESNQIQKQKSALDSKTCPLYIERGLIHSICHIPDRQQDSRCSTSQDCGVDHSSCQQKDCVDVSGQLSCATKLPMMIQQIREATKKRLSSQLKPMTHREQSTWQYASILAKQESETMINSPEVSNIEAPSTSCSDLNANFEAQNHVELISVESWLQIQTQKYYELLLQEHLQ